MPWHMEKLKPIFFKSLNSGVVLAIVSMRKYLQMLRWLWMKTWRLSRNYHFRFYPPKKTANGTGTPSSVFLCHRLRSHSCAEWALMTRCAGFIDGSAIFTCLPANSSAPWSWLRTEHRTTTGKQHAVRRRSLRFAHVHMLTDWPDCRTRHSSIHVPRVIACCWKLPQTATTAAFGGRRFRSDPLRSRKKPMLKSVVNAFAWQNIPTVANYRTAVCARWLVVVPCSYRRLRLLIAEQPRFLRSYFCCCCAMLRSPLGGLVLNLCSFICATPESCARSRDICFHFVFIIAWSILLLACLTFLWLSVSAWLKVIKCEKKAQGAT